MTHTKLVVSPDGVWLNGVQIKDCDEVTIKDVNPTKRPIVMLRVTVDEVDVQYAQLPFLHELRKERKNTD